MAKKTTKKAPKAATKRAAKKVTKKAAKKPAKKVAKKAAAKPVKKAAKKAAKKTARKAAAKPVKKAARKATKKTAARKTKSAAKPVKAAKAKELEAPLFADALAAVEQEEAAAAAAPSKRSRKAPSYATAEQMAKSQRSISVSEFFAKNRHLLGFDNPRKALLTTVKEAVDNALDACEEAGILPVVDVVIEQVSETHFRLAAQDNGPGIVRKQIPSIFGQLLYGSKFHRLRMSRGQQGIGISAAGMYGLLTTGQPVKITSRTGKRANAHHYELQIDTRKNRPDINVDDVVEWDVDHGTRVEIELEARYQRGRQSVDDYLQQTAIANPHVTFHYTAPDGRTETYKASIKALPAVPKSIRPHPHGIELGVLLKMAADTKARTIQQFLTSEFSRVSPRVAGEIIEAANLAPRRPVRRLTGDDVKAVYQAIQTTKIMAPATDCVVPIGEEQLIAGLKHVVEAEFYTAVSRSPSVYRGNPFVIEAAIAYGKPESANGDTAAKPSSDDAAPETDDDNDTQQLAKVMRFANRVPLQYQQGACAITKAVLGLNWKSYGLSQSRGALPSGPLTIVVHMASVWVPFTSESKEAVASYPEILKDLRLALQECGRKLGAHIRKRIRIGRELKKRSYIETYIPAIGEALRDILELKDRQVASVCNSLKDVLERSRKF
ncbi:MAG: DNA topoisomerase VI subunit B [Planctomycetota bacterium]|jgi:DNA topoisomerase-6 subunit B